MTTLRTDLLDLGTDALMALSNPGFVKRAQKDVAAGALPALRQDADGTVHAQFEDGAQTSMGPGVALRDAACNCAASGMCRHRVMLVLAYQASRPAAPDEPTDASDGAPSGWSPAAFDDAAIAAVAGPQALEQAHRLARERPVVTVVAGAAGGVPAAILPMSQVRFFSAASLALARCDCRQGTGCAHVVLACWAFRQAARTRPDAAEVTLAVAPPDEAPSGSPRGSMEKEAALRVREQAQDWLWSLWREGAGQPLAGLEARHEALQAGLAALGWTWVREDLETVWRILQSLAHRSNRFGIGDLLAAGARLHLRLAGAAHADASAAPLIPASRILGIGQPGETPLDQLRLVSLGMTCWRDADSEGAGIVFADPDTQAACVLERTWPLEAGAPDDPVRLLNRRVAGHPLRLLAAGQVVTRTARRRANARLELGGQARDTGVLALSPKAWEDLRAPLRFDTLADLSRYLRTRAPDGIRPGEAGGDWHVAGLAGLTLENWAWDGARQTLYAQWRDGDGIGLHARLGYESQAPGAVDALARALGGEWGAPRAIAGPAWRERGGVAMRPASVMTERRAIVLALEPKAPQAMAIREMPLAADAAEALLRESLDLLAEILRQGLRHGPPALRARVAAQAARLDEAGYGHAALLLRNAFAERRDAAGVAPLSALCLLLEELLS